MAPHALAPSSDGSHAAVTPPAYPRTAVAPLRPPPVLPAVTTCMPTDCGRVGEVGAGRQTREGIRGETGDGREEWWGGGAAAWEEQWGSCDGMGARNRGGEGRSGGVRQLEEW